MNKVFIALLLTCLPCLADTFEVYYPSTMSIINTGFTNGNNSVNPKVFVDGLDCGKRVLYAEHNLFSTSGIYSFTFVPSKNVKGKVIITRIQQ